MENLVKSAAIIGQVIGLVVGNKLTIPISETLEKYPSLVRFTS